jgi:hypothetical protein
MRLDARYILIAVFGLLLAGCRQADGPVPAPDKGVQEDLGDVGRDLQYIAKGSDPAAPQDLTQDLVKYVNERPPAAAAVNELTRRTAAVVAGTNLPNQTSQRLAHNFWVTIMAHELSERQIEALQNDTQTLLMSTGISEENARQVAAQVGEVQKVVTTRQRRWYELF